jgi:hypothetical protein
MSIYSIVFMLMNSVQKKLPNFFNIVYLNQWYFLDNSNYLLLKNYVEKLNYLRLLMIEYLNDNYS